MDGLEELTVPFTSEVVDQVVRDMPADRAPMPDGFDGCFLNHVGTLSKRSYTRFAWICIKGI